MRLAIAKFNRLSESELAKLAMLASEVQRLKDEISSRETIGNWYRRAFVAYTGSISKALPSAELYDCLLPWAANDDTVVENLSEEIENALDELGIVDIDGKGT